jgi:tetratricopeptide (TPR) repeat protein
VARKHYSKQIIQVLLGVLLLVVCLIGLAYGSLLRAMDRAAEDYSRGDAAGALAQYDDVEQGLRSLGAIRLVPGADRRILFLDQARMLYALGRYDEALERLDRENQISGTVTDGRFLLLRGDITFRKAVQNSRASGNDDPHMLAEALGPAQDDLRESLREDPQSWDAKYNFEYLNYLRNILEKDKQEGMKVLPQIPDQDNSQQNLTPKQKM